MSAKTTAQKKKTMQAIASNERGSPDVLELNAIDKPEVGDGVSRLPRTERDGGAMKAIVQAGYGAPERVLKLGYRYT